MLRSYNKMVGFSVHATDGEIGKIRDFIFDEPVWTVRYAEIDIDGLASGKYILLSTIVLGPTALTSIASNLSMEQIVDCPVIDPETIPTRNYEEELHNYFSWTYYWAEQSEISPYKTSYKLQRIKKIRGYQLLALDGELGHISDLLIDDLQWKIRYCVVDTGTWLFGKKVLVSPDWFKRIDDAQSMFEIDTSQEKIRTAPHFDSTTPLTSEYEFEIYSHYDKKPYWD